MSTPLEDVIHSYGSEVLCSQEVIEKYRQKANIELVSLRENAFASAQLRTELAAKDAQIVELKKSLKETADRLDTWKGEDDENIVERAYILLSAHPKAGDK